MDFTFPLAQDIGTNYGENNDGVLLGKIAPVSFDAESYFSYAHQITWAIQANNNDPVGTGYTWTPQQSSYNNSTAIQPFLPLNVSNPIPQLYLAVRTGITSFKFNVTTAMVGTATFSVYYNSPTGYILLPGATLSSNFFKQTGISTITFTPPTNWQSDPCGYEPAGSQRWLKLVLTGGTVTTQATVTGAWEVSSTISAAGSNTANPPFYNPYKSLLPQAGDTLYMSTTLKPFGTVITYATPLTGGTVSYTYSKADGTYAPLTVISDTSAGFTYNNTATYNRLILTSSAATASYYSTEALETDGYVQAVVQAVPTSSTNRFMIGLDANRASPLQFGLSCGYAGGVAQYQIFENGTQRTSNVITPAIGDIIEVWRYQGKVYYFVNGVNIAPLLTPTASTGVISMFVTATDTGIAIPVSFINWSNRLANNLTVTASASTNFTTSSASITRSLPGHYYIQFVPPTDFASVGASLSKTGVAGYGIGIVTAGSPTSNISLMQQQGLTVNAPGNTYFVTGEQTIFQHTSLILGEPDNYVNPNTFLYLVTNAAGYSARSVVFDVPSTPVQVINKTVASVGVTGMIIIQVAGDAEINVGVPSSITIST